MTLVASQGEALDGFQMVEEAADQARHEVIRRQLDPLEAVALGEVAVAQEYRKASPELPDESEGTLNSVDLYLQEIGRFPLLTAAEEKTLGRAIMDGKTAAKQLASSDDTPLSLRKQRELEAKKGAAEKARTTFILSNLRMVVAIAKRYPTNSSLELLDLIQEGNLGLFRAVDQFDWRKGFKFSTFAYRKIRAQIGRAIDDKSRTIRMPERKSKAVRRGKKQAGEKGEELDENDQNLARLEAATTPISLDSPLGDGDETIQTRIANPAQRATDSEALTRLDLAALGGLLDSLTDRERQAVRLRFQDDSLAMSEIGQAIGLGGNQAGAVVKHALAKMHFALDPEKASPPIGRRRRKQAA